VRDGKWAASALLFAGGPPSCLKQRPVRPLSRFLWSSPPSQFIQEALHARVASLRRAIDAEFDELVRLAHNRRAALLVDLDAAHCRLGQISFPAGDTRTPDLADIR